MIRTVLIPDSNFVGLPIPDIYVGKELEIIVFLHDEISVVKPEKEVTGDGDPSFGSWADMDKSTEEICAEIKSSRSFRKTDLTL
ncbi:MAG: hypothetical protein LBQ73_06815 [Tannerellaceae bacterium]|jgi:hypothetical protein|nr:hypothetical protein [Tannerellaceae bacterium]